MSLSVDKAETYMLKGGSEDKPVAVLSHNKSPVQPGRPPVQPVMPIGPEDPTVPGPGVSVKAKIRKLQMQKKQLMRQIAQIDLQLRSLLKDTYPIRPPGGAIPPWAPVGPGGGQQPPTPIGPPTPIDPGLPVPIGPGTPVPVPPRPVPPWGG